MTHSVETRHAFRTAAALAAAIVLVELLVPAPAHAYLDPGSGSLIFQWLIAGLVGGAFIVKSLARRLAHRFKRRPTDEAPGA